MFTVLTLALLFPAVQIIWPERWTPGNPCVDDDDNPVFIITVDGVHCRIHKPKHPTLSKNPQFYSHKFNQAGVNYELGLSVIKNRHSIQEPSILLTQV